jgi:putative transcriptional regulator
MTVSHPVGDDLLMGYAAGLLPEAHDLMVATAVSLDDEARARLSGFEAMGGALLDECEVAPLRDDSFEAVMGRITGVAKCDTVPDDCKVPWADAVFPQPLRDAVGGDIDDVAWKPVGLGVHQAILAGDDDGTARLLRIPGGQAMPDHGHQGAEYTLVLQGAFIDGEDRFARGDLEMADDSIEHMPVADLGEDCVCLVVTDAPLRFTGLLPRLAQRFINI